MSLNLYPGHVVRIDRPGEGPPADPESAYRVVVDVDEATAQAVLRELDDENAENLTSEPLSVLTITGHI
jgi:hypothetical protein